MCKRQEKTDDMTGASRSNQFEVLSTTERGLEAEAVNVVESVQGGGGKSPSNRVLLRAYGRRV